MISDSSKKFSVLRYLRDWYGRFERPISSISLVGGFVFDAVTLTRVDQFWENFWVVAHLVIVGACIIWIHHLENAGSDEKDPEKIHFWLVNILQFFFGGLLSTFLVFYFRSSDIAVSWPFLLLLTLAFIANERLKERYVRLRFQVSLFFLSLYSFAIFLVPVVLHRIGTPIFLLSGVVSLIGIAIFLRILFYTHKRKYTEHSHPVYLVIGIIFVVINLLYFTHILPPIPLSLKDAGVYHSISRDSQGDYVVGYEDIGWRQYVTLYPDFHVTPGEPVFVYSAVFSPSDLNTTIIHEWQYYDPQTHLWVTQGTVDLSVVGGRDGGFRTYSAQENLSAGEWRVNVKTTTGEVIGRVRFTIVPVASDADEPTISVKTNN